MSSFREIFWAELKKHKIDWCMGPGCQLSQSHTRGFATRDPIMCLGRHTGEHRLTVHLASSIATRSTLHRGLHEIGHLVNDERGMRRYERELAANQFAERRMRELGIPVPRGEAAKGRQYVSRMRRWGQSISRGLRPMENGSDEEPINFPPPAPSSRKKYIVHVTWKSPAWDEKDGADIEMEARSKSEACKYVRNKMRRDGHMGVMYFRATEAVE